MPRPTRAECVILTALLLLAAPAVVPMGVELARAAGDTAAWRDTPISGARWVVLARSVGIAGLVALVSTLMALPMAQVLRTRGPRVAPLLVAPVWIPAWLIYAGLNLARAPDTVLGKALMDWALPDHRGLLVALGPTVAVASVALWCAPLAALAMSAVESPEPDAAREALRLERITPPRRVWERLRLRAGPIGVSLGVTALVTLGSAVPLHLAQVETDAISLWRALAERTPARWGGVFLGAWPEMLIAVAGAWWLVVRLGRAPAPGIGATPESTPRLSWGTRILAWGVWALAAVAPTALMASSLDSVSSLGRWVRLEGGALGVSSAYAAAGGLASALMGVGVAAAAGSNLRATRVTARVLSGVALFGAVAPGVLTGAAVARLDLDGVLASVLGCVARVAFVGAVAGLVSARAESPDERAFRALDGAGDAWGWLRANAWRACRLAGGVWVGAFVLALHEIEASVMVRPPGLGNLPQQMLSDLHYARVEQLSAGGVVMGLAGIGLGALAGWALGAGKGFRRRQLPWNGDVPHSV